MMKALISGFISHSLSKPISKTPKPSLSLANYDMYILRPWYKAIKEHYGDESPSLVVLLQDLHSTEPSILRDFLEICSCHLPFIPISVLMGSSDADYLHSVLPRLTLSYLRLERFWISSDMKTLQRVIKETFFSPTFKPPVMLGPKAIEIIFTDFQKENATFDAMISTIQLLYMQHFYHPLSILINPQFDTSIEEALESEEDWKPFMKLLRQRLLPSTIRKKEWTELSPEAVLEAAIDSRALFSKQLTDAKIALHLFDVTTIYLKNRGVKGSILSFQTAATKMLEGTLADSVVGICNAIRALESSELKTLLADLLYSYLFSLPPELRSQELEDLRPKMVVVQGSNTPEVHLDIFLKPFRKWLEANLRGFDDIPCLDVWWTGETTIPNSPSNPNPHIAIVTSLLDPRMYLGWNASGKDNIEENPTAFPDVCTLFRRYLESGRMINIYDWYQSFSVSFEDAQSDDDESDDDEMDVDVEDTPTKKRPTRGTASPAKKTAQPDEPSPVKKKRGRPPKAVPPPPPPPPTSSKKKQKKRAEANPDLEHELQARFLRVMHELGFAGFLKHTGRKADHVVKTVFDVLD
ncbi:hypothetical protein M422DRAFT_781917 [Sphaerobolus stellatus SS14]|uniref:Origin recognition complex subunit 3 n=1 Tax=Sphaerobolus stellatus (strain SS14) TaxID=990650 RepID=A0A0C9VID9_SPHS4|nr:hypothetical protein M422DRAFT_781917 [Sphaerobolus stellatus SS14]